MGWRGLFEGWHIVLLIIVVILVFGWKKLPDAARSMGRSMRIFKSEMGEMKNDGKSAASRDTVRGDVIHNPENPDRAQSRDAGQGDGHADPQRPSHEHQPHEQHGA